MAAFRLVNQAARYFLADGQVNAGGSLSFYETDLTTPKDTWSNEGLSVLNPNPLPLDAGGIAENDVWMDGEYGVVLKDADGVTIWTRNNVRDTADPGAVIPPLLDGQFLTNNGSILQWQEIIQVPDPTGQAGKVLGTDGTLVFWQSLAAVAANAILTQVTGGFKLSNGTNAYMVQFLTGTVSPPSGTTTSSQAFSFGTAFSSTPQAVATVRDRANPGGGVPACFIQGLSSGGGALVIDTNGFNNIVNTVPFDIIAIGTVAP